MALFSCGHMPRSRQGRAKLSYLVRTRAPHYDRRGKRRRHRAAPELQPSPQHEHVRCTSYVKVPPASVRTGRHQANHHCATGRLASTLRHPGTELSPIRWVHEDPALPGYVQSVVVNGQTNPSFHPRPLSVGRGRTWVQVKPAEHAFEGGY